MALQTNLPLMNTSPDAAGNLTRGLGLGGQFAQQRAVNRERDQLMDIRAQEAKRQRAQDKDLAATRAFTFTDGAPITLETYLPVMEDLRAAGIELDVDDMESNPENVDRLNNLINYGSNLIAQQAATNKRSAVKGVEGELTFKDAEGNIFSQQTFLDPNTQTTRAVLTDISGRGAQPVGPLSPVSKMGETVAEETMSEADRASAIAEAKTTAEYTAKLAKEPELRAKIKAAEVRAQARGEAQASLDEQKANMPMLVETVDILRGLSDEATYTKMGRARDFVFRELGLEVPEGAKAAVAYQTTIDNVVLPLLKDTFGAQFTEKEGARLAATLGSTEKSPAEKQEALDAFLTQKQLQLERGERRVQGQPDVVEVDVEIEDLINQYAD